MRNNPISCSINVDNGVENEDVNMEEDEGEVLLNPLLRDNVGGNNNGHTERHRNHRSKPHGSSIPATLLFFMKANLGTGLLALPRALSNSGLLAGILVMVAVGGLLTYSSHILMDLGDFARGRMLKSKELKKLREAIPKSVKKSKRAILRSILESFKYFEKGTQTDLTAESRHSEAEEQVDLEAASFFVDLLMRALKKHNVFSAMAESSSKSSQGSDLELTESGKEFCLGLAIELENVLDRCVSRRSDVMERNPIKNHLLKIFFLHISSCSYGKPDPSDAHFQEKVLYSDVIEEMLKEALVKALDQYPDMYDIKDIKDIPNEDIMDEVLISRILQTLHKWLETFIGNLENSVNEYSDIIGQAREFDIDRNVAVAVLQEMLDDDPETSDDESEEEEDSTTVDYHTTMMTTLKYSQFKQYEKQYSYLFGVLLFSTHFFCCCTCFVFVADTLREVGICGKHYENGTSFEVVGYALPFILSLILVSETGDDLTGVVFISCTLQVVGIILLVVHLFMDKHSDKLIRYAAPFEKWPLFFSPVLYAFEGTGVFLDLQSHMRNRTMGGHVYNISMFLILPVYILVGSLGYWKYGDDVEYSITFNLPESGLTVLIQVLTTLGILLTYPFHMSHLLQLLKQPFQDLPCSKNSKKVVNYLMRILIFLGSFLYTIYIPDLELQILISGAIFVCLLVIIFPHALYISACDSLMYEKNVHICRILLSLLIFVIGVTYLIWSGIRLRQIYPQFYANFTIFG